MTEICYFYKNGNIIYKNRNLITGDNIILLPELTYCEVINHNDVYIDKNTNKYYHKFSFGNKNSFLEWKQAKDSNWEWYISDKIENELVCFNTMNINNNTSILDTLKIKNELFEKIINTMNKHNISKNKSELILLEFSKIIDTHI